MADHVAYHSAVAWFEQVLYKVSWFEQAVDKALFVMYGELLAALDVYIAWKHCMLCSLGDYNIVRKPVI